VRHRWIGTFVGAAADGADSDTLYFVDDQAKRRQLSDDGRGWAAHRASKFLAREERSGRGLWARLASARLLPFLESLWFTRAYVRELIAAADVERLIVLDDVPQAHVTMIAEAASAAGCALVAGARETWRSRLREVAAFLAFSARFIVQLWRWRRRPPSVPETTVLVEAGSIQSIRNCLPLLRSAPAAVGVTLYGAPRNDMDGPGMDNHDCFALSRWTASQMAQTTEVVNTLACFPLRSTWRLVALAIGLAAALLRPSSGPIDYALRSLAREYVKTAAMRLSFRVLCGRARPRVLLVTLPTSLCGRVAEACHGLGVRRYFLQGGLLASDVALGAFARDFDGAFLWGAGFADTLTREFEWDPRKVIVTGNHRPLPLLHVGTERRPGVVLFTSQPAMDAGEHPWRALQWLIEITAREASWQLVVRPHPREDRHRLEAHVRRLANSLVVLSPPERAMAEDVSRADCLVSRYSTTLLEGASAGLPVVGIDCDARYDRGGIAAWLGAGFVTDPRRLRDTLVEIMGEDGFRRQLCTAQRRGLDRYLQSEGEPGVARIGRSVFEVG
jgi:hypothetical protein